LAAGDASVAPHPKSRHPLPIIPHGQLLAQEWLFFIQNAPLKGAAK